MAMSSDERQFFVTLLERMQQQFAARMMEMTLEQAAAP
jgi:hypothetical protein